MAKLIPFTPFALLAFSTLAGACLALAPVPGRPVAALFPPWWTPAQAFAAMAAAGGTVTRLTGLPTILVAAPDAPELAQRLRSSGALLVMDAKRLGGCTIDP